MQAAGHRADLGWVDSNEVECFVLTKDLTSSSIRDERGESKWESDSRNVNYGIFPATPTSVPSDGLTIVSASSGM
jgi:hypothetical protein